MQKITPCLWFDSKAEEAAHFYVSLFAGSRMLTPSVPTLGEAPEPLVVECEVAGQRLQFINGGPHYKQTPAFSLSVICEDQAEVDLYWEALIADGGEESMCGWLLDRWGVSWQIIPRRLNELVNSPDRAQAQRVNEAMMKMKKLVVADLDAAANLKDV